MMFSFQMPHLIHQSHQLIKSSSPLRTFKQPSKHMFQWINPNEHDFILVTLVLLLISMLIMGNKTPCMFIFARRNLNQRTLVHLNSTLRCSTKTKLVIMVTLSSLFTRQTRVLFFKIKLKLPLASILHMLDVTEKAVKSILLFCKRAGPTKILYFWYVLTNTKNFKSLFYRFLILHILCRDTHLSHNYVCPGDSRQRGCFTPKIII